MSSVFDSRCGERSVGIDEFAMTAVFGCKVKQWIRNPLKSMVW